MGLDIYFAKAKRSAYYKYQEDEREFDKLSEEEKEEIWAKNEQPKIEGNEEIGYFRKVNFLMQELAYYGNCEFKEITRDSLEELKRKCLAVLENHELAEDLLPTCSGFFYGSTEYDEWYFQDVQAVLDWVEGVLENLAGDEVVLMYCWW